MDIALEIRTVFSIECIAIAKDIFLKSEKDMEIGFYVQVNGLHHAFLYVLSTCTYKQSTHSNRWR